MVTKTNDKPVALALKNSKFWTDYTSDFAASQENGDYFYVPWTFPSKINQKQLKSLGDSAIVHSTLDHILLFFVQGEEKIEIYKGVLDQIIFADLQKSYFEKTSKNLPAIYDKTDVSTWNTIFKLKKLIHVNDATAELIANQYVKSNDEPLDIEDYKLKERGPRFLFL